ncbi:hypothetical protein AGMMS4957_22340 [Bacteroidia bacterium]|nr:hypothetical protein AGMMS4957_22340 [Bacteroidia bacterium]
MHIVQKEVIILEIKTKMNREYENKKSKNTGLTACSKAVFYAELKVQILKNKCKQ